MSHKEKHPGLKQRLRKAARQERKAILDEVGYPVGYCKPPRASQFSSTNQPLRRRGRKQFKDPFEIFFKELFGLVDVTEHGRTRKMSKLQVVMRQLVNKSTTGDPKAFTTALGILLRPSPNDGASDADVSKAKSEDTKRGLREQMRKLLQAQTEEAHAQPGATVS